MPRHKENSPGELFLQKSGWGCKELANLTCGLVPFLRSFPATNKNNKVLLFRGHILQPRKSSTKEIQHCSKTYNILTITQIIPLFLWFFQIWPSKEKSNDYYTGLMMHRKQTSEGQWTGEMRPKDYHYWAHSYSQPLFYYTHSSCLGVRTNSFTELWTTMNSLI